MILLLYITEIHILSALPFVSGPLASLPLESLLCKQLSLQLCTLFVHRGPVDECRPHV